MAVRPSFKLGDGIQNFYQEENFDFQFFTGFALSQKRKSITSLHQAILAKYPASEILEVSRKSAHVLGTRLSAFNLLFNLNGRDYPVENVFQSSKVFTHGGPFTDLLQVPPADAKRDERLKSSGDLLCFMLDGKRWDLLPRTMFYDHLYLSALSRNDDLTNELIKFDTFTDIEFNPQKSLNCQARSVAIFVTLVKLNKLQAYLDDLNLFKTIYSKVKSEPVQLSLF